MIGRSGNDYFFSKVLSYSMTHFAFFWHIVNRIGPLARWMNRRLIDRAVRRSDGRPNPFSTLADYTSWESLTDKTWFGRHLPPPQSTSPGRPQPPLADVIKLFDRRLRKPGKPVESEKSTLLFPTFAQWFTDGFLLTDKDHRLKTHTNHDIDFSQLYGLKKAETYCLRLNSKVVGKRGRLKSETIADEEYALKYFESDGTTIRPEFAGLRPPLHLRPELPVEKRRTIFAFGGERANATSQTAMMNTLFLREHNRLAGLLEQNHPGWDDERVFQTARNIVVVLLIKIVVEEYINHISPYHFQFLADPWAVWSVDWNRPNWIAAEFNLLYRWHSLVPETFDWHGKKYPLVSWLFNNDPLTEHGLASAFVATSKQKATALGLYNTPEFLLPFEASSIQQGRTTNLGTYNDYRIAVGFPPARTFEDISDNPDICRELELLYKEPGNVEFYVGLFAENSRPNATVMALIGRFVAIDAFSQALTNPLLSRYVFNAQTFSTIGMECIESTHCLETIVNRNVPKPAPEGSITMKQK